MITMCQLYTIIQVGTGLSFHSLLSPAFLDNRRKKMGGKMKLRHVIVVAPIRSKIAPKSGRDNPRSRSKAMTVVLKIILFGPNSMIFYD